MEEKSVEVVVRQYEDRDGPDVVRIWTAGLQQTVDECSWFSKSYFRKQFDQMAAASVSEEGDFGPDGALISQKWMGKPKDGTFLVATMGEKVVGCAGLKRGFSFSEDETIDPNQCSVWRVSVDEVAWRKGVGSKMMEASEKWAIENGMKQMTLITVNPAAQKFYKKNGYTYKAWNSYVMVKDLQVVENEKESEQTSPE